MTESKGPKVFPKGLHERFARFFEDPRRESLRDLLRESGGEYNHLDFKREWLKYPKLARHILAFANSGGGCMIIGVEDGSNAPVGIEKVVDKTEAFKHLQPYLARQCVELVSIHDFRFEGSEYPTLVGKTFQVIFIEDNPRNLPHIAVKDGEGIQANAIYVRSNASSEPASHEALQSLVNRRIETSHSSRGELDLQVHLDQLKLLFTYVSPGAAYPKALEAYLEQQLRDIDQWAYRANPNYPREDFTAFIIRMIRAKKIAVERELGVEGLTVSTGRTQNQPLQRTADAAAEG